MQRIPHETIVDITRCAALLLVLVITGGLLMIDLLQDGQLDGSAIPGPWWGVVGGAMTYFTLFERRPGGGNKDDP